MLAVELGQATDEVPIIGHGSAAMGEFAGRLLVHYASEGVVPRLLFWEGQECGAQVSDRGVRADLWSSKVDDALKVLQGISKTDAAELLLTVLTLCGGWLVLPQVDALLVSDRRATFSRREAFVVRLTTIAAEALLSGAFRSSL